MRLDRIDPRTIRYIRNIARHCEEVYLDGYSSLMVPQRQWQQAKAIAFCVAVRLFPELSAETIGDLFGCSEHPGPRRLLDRSMSKFDADISQIIEDFGEILRPKGREASG